MEETEFKRESITKERLQEILDGIREEMKPSKPISLPIEEVDETIEPMQLKGIAEQLEMMAKYYQKYGTDNSFLA